MQLVIICDLDGTLSNPIERVHHLETKDYDSFYSKVKNDSCYLDVVLLLQELSPKYKIYILTGRPERTREDTMEWLAQNNIPVDKIFFRKNRDYRPDYIIKKEMLQSIKEPIWFAIEDRNQVVKMYREEGILCLQCKDGSY